MPVLVTVPALSGMAVLAALAAAAAVWWLVPEAAMTRLRPDPLGGLLGRVRAAVTSGRWRGGPAGRLGRPGRRERRRADLLRASVPAVCDLLAVCLEAGRPPRAALRVVAAALDGPAAEALAGVLQRIDLGVDEAEAWHTLAAEPGFREVGRDLARSVRSGVGLSALLRQHARDARQELAAAALVAARSAGVRSVVPMMVCFLPAFMLLGVVPLFGALLARLLP